MKKVLYALITIIGFGNATMAQTQINNVSNFSDFSKSTTSSQVTAVLSPNVGFNFSSSVTATDTGYMYKIFRSNTNNCTKLSVQFDMNLGNGKGLDVIVNGGNNSTTGWTDIYRTSSNSPAPNTDWGYNRDFYTNSVDIKLKFSTLANTNGVSIVKNLIVTGYPTGCVILCNDSIITTEPTNTNVGVGLNAQITTASANGSSYQWQTNPLDLGWQNVSNNNSYTGASTNALTINKVSVSNHNQAFRALVNSNGCADTSKVVYLKVADTCLTKVTDTILTTVTDTLIIKTTVGLPTPNTTNTLLIYPNPAKDRITIDNGNYTVMAGYSIKIENSLGQQVFSSAITQAQFNIDLSTWTGKGIYFVRVLDTQGNVVTTRKILLQ